MAGKRRVHPPDTRAGAKRPRDSGGQLRRSRSRSRSLSLSLYAPLDISRKEIRLVVLEPGEHEQPVCGTFRSTFLSDEAPLRYETVSYVWGDATLRGSINLHQRPVDVPSSAARVLRRLRLADRPRTVWIDAICINQADLDERARQVAFMGEIYSSCSRNIIWLGEEDETTASAIKSIRLLNQEVTAATAKGVRLVDLYYPAGVVSESTGGLKVRVRESALRRFYGHPWFSRLWVVQEAALAPESICLCGTHQVALRDVLQAALWIRYKGVEGVAERLAKDHAVSLACNLADWTLADTGYQLTRPLRGRALAALLASVRDFRASDPRDHVYAILGLWLKSSQAESLPAQLVPDYTASLPNVLQAATVFAIRERQDLEVLKFVSYQPGEARLPDLPSWTHRWDRPFDPVRDPSVLTHHDRRADAGLRMAIDETFTDTRTLLTRGYVVSDVKKVVPEMRERKSASFRQYLRAIERIVRETHSGDERSFESQVGVILQAGTTSTSGIAQAVDSGPAYAIYKRALLNIDSAYPYHNANLSKMSAPAQKKVAAQFALGMITACYDRNFFSTTSGNFGLGPKTTTVGDLVAVIAGSAFPVMLRQLSSGPEDFEFVGVCYVHGAMSGEVVEHHLPAGNKQRLFRLL